MREKKEKIGAGSTANLHLLQPFLTITVAFTV